MVFTTAFVHTGIHCQYGVAVSIIDTGTLSVEDTETKLYTEFLYLTIKQYESFADLNIS